MPDIQTYLTQESQHWFFTVLYLSILKNPIQAEKTYEVAILQVCTISCSELIFHIVRILFLDLDPAHKNQDPDLNKGLKTVLRSRRIVMRFRLRVKIFCQRGRV
jgi:hypothetical protein